MRRFKTSIKKYKNINWADEADNGLLYDVICETCGQNYGRHLEDRCHDDDQYIKRHKRYQKLRKAYEKNNLKKC